MVKRSIIFFSLMLVFLALSLAVIYYLVTANFYTNSSLFWIGGVAGFSVSVFLISIVLLLFYFLTKTVPTKKFKLTILVLIISALIFAVIYFSGRYSMDSDIWWYGTIAGFLSGLSFACLASAVYVGYKLLSYHSKEQISYKR